MFEGKIRIFIYTLLIRLSDLVFSGTITYSFVTTPDERLKFAINNTNGVIVTIQIQILDRGTDSLMKRKLIYEIICKISFLFSSGAVPRYSQPTRRSQLDDLCTFKVTITDTNDNPIFDKAVRR